MHTVRFHLYKILKNANESTESQKADWWLLGDGTGGQDTDGEGQVEGLQRSTE